MNAWGLALTAALAAAPAAAQEAGAAGDTLVLTLDEAMRLAEGSNPAYRRAANSVGLNDVETRTTWATQVLPRATLNVFDTEYTGNLQNISRDNFGNPIENPQSDWVYFSNTRQSLSLNWTLQGTSIFNDLARQRYENRDRTLAEEGALAQLHAGVRRQFYGVLQQRALLDAERRLAASRVVEREIAERRFRLAQTTRVDVLNAELAEQSQALSVERQRGSWEQAKLALRTRLGDADLPPLRLSDEPLPVFDPSALDADVLVARAEGANPEMKQADAAVSSAALGVKEAKNSWWPDLTFGVNFYRRAQAREKSALFDLSFDEELESNFYVSLSVPFFNNYFQNRQAIERSEVQLENQRESLREASLALEESVRAALVDLRNQYEAFRLATRAAEIALETLELARQEYRLGTRTYEQLRTSIDQEADARREVISARFGFVDALITLEEAVGAPLRGEEG